MLSLETAGTWPEMGRQYGRTFATELGACLDHYCPGLRRDHVRHRTALDAMRDELAEHCPDLLDETRGMAEAADLPFEALLGYRFRQDLALRPVDSPGCSVVFVLDERRGPMLAANVDIETRFSPDIQVCRTCRPTGQPATITTTYLGLPRGNGLNEHGLAMAGASAHTTLTALPGGLSGTVLGHELLHRCRRVDDAIELAARHPFRGKSANLLVADAGGASAVLEMAPGRHPAPLRRGPSATWQVCTNFFLSGEIPIQHQPEYLRSAYARYGRLLHQFQLGRVDATPEGLGRLLADVAQPGFCCTDNDGTFRTAYALVMQLQPPVLHLYPGHPGEVSPQVRALSGTPAAP